MTGETGIWESQGIPAIQGSRSPSLSDCVGSGWIQIPVLDQGWKQCPAGSLCQTPVPDPIAGSGCQIQIPALVVGSLFLMLGLIAGFWCEVPMSDPAAGSQC